MHDRPRNRTLRSVAMLALIAIAGPTLAGCGSSNPATQLLSQTFTGKHRVISGNLGLSITISPSGSSALKSPITLSLGGPFQSLGPGKLPKSNFSLGLATGGGNVSVALLSTGTKGYVTFQGQSYQLPQATFQRLESSFAQLGSSPSSRRGSGVLARLGIQPEHWLVNPQVVGNEALGGTNTTHIRAGINIPALLGDLNTFLRRASAVGASAGNLPTAISASERRQIARAIRNPAIDVWTGADDKTLRRLELRLTLALTGQAATLLGPSATLALTMQYANLNRPQTIVAPTSVQPYSEFQAKLKVLLADLQSGLGGGLGSSSGGTSTGTTGANSTYENYTQCMQAAGGDVAKMQKCAPLLNGG
jgi:hypothetical protein